MRVSRRFAGPTAEQSRDLKEKSICVIRNHPPAPPRKTSTPPQRFSFARWDSLSLRRCRPSWDRPLPIPVIAPGSAYRQTNLLSDLPGVAPVLDPLLVNPWGISLTASSPFWVANNGTSTTQLIRGEVGGAPVVLNPSPQTVTIPGGLPDRHRREPCRRPSLFCRERARRRLAAQISSSLRSPATSPDGTRTRRMAGSTTAVIAASHPGHVYTGLAYANNGSGNFIYAADFANGTIDVFDSSFALQPAASFPFADPTIPTTMGNTYPSLQYPGYWRQPLRHLREGWRPAVSPRMVWATVSCGGLTQMASVT